MHKPIFLGVTPSSSRAYVADDILKRNPARAYFPCAGRFTVPQNLALNGYQGEILCSDISLFSSILGYAADPTRRVSDLNITLPKDAPGTPQDDDIGKAARVLFYLGFNQIHPNSIYAADVRDEYRQAADEHIGMIRHDIESFCSAMGPRFRYEMRDIIEVMREAMTDPDAVIYSAPPFYPGGYTKMFDAPELKWDAPVLPEFDPGNLWNVMDELKDAPCRSYIFLRQDLNSGDARKHKLPEGWHSLHALDQGHGQVDHVISNMPGISNFASSKKRSKSAKLYEIYGDQDITEDSEVRFIIAQRESALYYRDLFVHRLGQTDAEAFLLMLVDGRVMTSMGVMMNHIYRFESEYISEVFGVSISSEKYARLSKLFMLCRSSGSMKEFLEASPLSLHGLHTFKGIKTTFLTKNLHGGQNRSMEKVSETHTKMPDGTYKIVYHYDFTDQTYKDCVKKWLKKWGAKSKGE